MFSLWKAAAPARTVWLFRAEGADITQEAADAFVGALGRTAEEAPTERVTFYDLSRLPLNFAPWALQLAGEVGRVRARVRPVRTVVFCDNAPARALLRCVLDAVGRADPHCPYVIVDSLEQGWEEAFAPAPERCAAVAAAPD